MLGACAGWAGQTHIQKADLPKILPSKIFGFVFFAPRSPRAQSARHGKNALAFLAPHQGKPIPKCTLSGFSSDDGEYLYHRSHLFPVAKRLTSHAPRSWWLESFSYAPLALESAPAALADSRGQTQKLPSISLHGSSPDPSAERRKEERKFLVCVASTNRPKKLLKYGYG